MLFKVRERAFGCLLGTGILFAFALVVTGCASNQSRADQSQQSSNAPAPVEEISMAQSMAQQQMPISHVVAYSTSASAAQQNAAVVLSPVDVTTRPAISFQTLPHGYSFTLNSDRLFMPQTGVLTSEGIALLDAKVMPVITRVHAKRVDISAYTDQTPSREEADKLTGLQANVVAAHIWAHGFSRLAIHDAGMGNQHPVSSNGSTQGQSDNRRVTIMIYPSSDKES